MSEQIKLKKTEFWHRLPNNGFFLFPNEILLGNSDCNSSVSGSGKVYTSTV